MSDEKKETRNDGEEKGVIGTTADVGKGAVKGTVGGVKKIGSAFGRGVKKLGKDEEAEKEE
jgi:hypothetical protein